ncbi:unnamed protein product [Rotaria sp. Silwood2]|nr:unnamed protein product [Rotaria sp. Silwood2]
MSSFVGLRVPDKKPTRNEEYQRTPCPFANKGICRYKDGECKYRHTKCQNYLTCSRSDCLLAHATERCRFVSGLTSARCMNDIRCYKAECPFDHPEGWTACVDGVQCTSYECTANHPPGRMDKCPHGDRCITKNNCKFLHPNNPSYEHLGPAPDVRLSTPLLKTKAPRDSPKKHVTEIVELTGAEQNFLQFFGDKTLDRMRHEPGIDEVTLKDNKLQLTGDRSSMTNIKSYLEQTLHKQHVVITHILKTYLERACKRRLLTKFLKQYRVGISYGDYDKEAQNKNDQTVKQSASDDEEQTDDDDDDHKSDISSASSYATNLSTVSKQARQCGQQMTQVTLCSDSEDSLAKAGKELQSYSLHIQSWPLKGEEVAFILKQPANGKLRQGKRNPAFQKSCQIKTCLDNIVQSKSNLPVQIFVPYKTGVWRVKVRGFKTYVDAGVVKIKNWLNDNVKTDVQLPISTVMCIYLRTKASSDIKKLEKIYAVKITTSSSAAHKHADDEQDDNHEYLKLTGSELQIKSAQTHVENFLESLSEKEKHFPRASWDIAKNILPILRKRLKDMQDSDDCEAIGWLKRYTASDRRDLTPRITVSIVGLNAEAVDDVIEQCQDIVEGYVVWKPSADEYRAINQALFVKNSPSLNEFRQQWNTEIFLDRDKGTIIIPAQSKMIADDIKEALLSLRGEKKPRVERIIEFIPIELKIRRFVNQVIGSVLNEAKSHRISVESRNRHGLKLHGRSDIVTELKQKIIVIVNDIQQTIVTQRLQLSSTEADLLRADRYALAERIERETNTIIRDAKVDSTGLPSTVTSDEHSSTIITALNSRGQIIVVAKGDITKVRNVDAIVNAANGPLYHAGGIDKAIADAAGPPLDQECKQLIASNGGLPLAAGKAVKTTAGNLPFKCVIHAIGPQYTDGSQQERPLLFSSVLTSLQLADAEGCRNVALPAISSRTYGFPMMDCTNIVVRAVKQFFADHPQSKVRKIVLLDMDDAACNSFAREVEVDHSSSVADNDDELTEYQLPPLTAQWCWQDDYDEKVNTDHDIRQIENAFQQYLRTFTPSELLIGADNLRSGTIVNYKIRFLPNLKQSLTSNPNALHSRLVCGHQTNVATGYTRHIIRYPVTAVQQASQPKPVQYHPKPLDSYEIKSVVAEEYWNITGMKKVTVEQAQRAIKAAIQSATIVDPFSVNLHKDFDVHKKELIKIGTQQSIQITFQETTLGQQLSMILTGFKPNVSEAKLQIALYAQDILKTQVEKDDELCIPKEWDDQQDGCKLVEIPRNDPTFVRIEKRMKETMSTVKIEKIERVQNVRMWSHYAFRRRELKKELRSKPNLQIEMELFHGTRSTLPSEIYNGEYGFDMTFSTSGMWGIGAYFAQNASYSCGGYEYKLPNGKAQAFLAQVLTGDVYDCNPDSSLRRPPKKDANVSNLRYNSVSGNTGGRDAIAAPGGAGAPPMYNAEIIRRTSTKSAKLSTKVIQATRNDDLETFIFQKFD